MRTGERNTKTDKNINMRAIIIFITLLITIAQIRGNNVAYQKDNTSETVQNLNKDTIIIIEKEVNEEAIQNYQQILEKTNNQLSLWYNPYGVFIAFLGILFGVLSIMAIYINYKQSKEHKDLIKKSLDDHKIALDKLIDENNKQIKIYLRNIDNAIADHKQDLSNANEEQKKQIKSMIKALEGQKSILDFQGKTYKHFGYKHKDIPENIPINANSIFYSKIVLNKTNQSFVIYIRLKTQSNKMVWIGFAGNSGDSKPYKTKDEYKLQNYGDPETNRIVINENILSVFKEGFPELNTEPIEIDCVRLRGSDENMGEITFIYNIL